MRAEEIRTSAHGYDELADDGILARDVMASIESAVVGAQCPSYRKDPSVLELQYNRGKKPIHVVWAIAKGYGALRLWLPCIGRIRVAGAMIPAGGDKHAREKAHEIRS